MASVLFGIQIAAVLLTFACIVLLMTQQNTGIAKLMLLTCICSFIQNAGYLLEMRSTNIYEAMMAIRFEYIGTAFIITGMSIFAFTYCKLRISPILKWILFGLGVVVLVCVWAYDVIPIYYTKVSFVDSGVMPHVEISKGFLYIIYAAAIYLEFMVCIVVALIATFKTTDANMRKNYTILSISCIIPLLFHLSGLIDVIPGYDPAPLGGAVGVVIFVSAIAFRHVFDVVETAHESIFAGLDEAVVILDYQGGFQEANNKAQELFPEILSTVSGENIKNEQFASLFESKGQSEIVIGSKFYEAHVNEVRKRGLLIGYTVVLFDVTESKYQLDRMTELREAADAANQAKSTFLASVSHEIRTPINVVVGMTDVIMRDYDDPKLLGYVNSIHDAAGDLMDLINDILDFSKIESGRTTLNTADYKVSRFFHDIVNTYEHYGEEKGVKFEKKISANIPAVLFGDETRIRQIMTNIITNAFKFTQAGSVTLKAAFEWAGDNNGNLILSVEDTGMGIKKEDLDKLFDIFVRLDERINRSVEGTGLGLNITKQLLELMGGEIKVYSEYGKGSVFTVIIPQVVHCDLNEVIGELDAEKKPALPKHKHVGYIAPTAQVLIVDDTKTNLIVAKALLRDTQVNVTTATSGNECLRLVQDNHYDVIFLDHRMPGMDGVETLHQMKSMDLCGSLPIIMLTANAVSDAKDYYLGEGFTDFIAKPISEETITGILEKYLPKSKIERIQ